MKIPIKLSSVEIMLLRWTSDGRSVAEIAVIEGRDRVEVQSLLTHVVSALGARSILDAIEKAKTSKII